MTANDAEGKQPFQQPRVVVVKSFDYKLEVAKSFDGKEEYLKIPVFINKKPIAQYLGPLSNILDYYALRTSQISDGQYLIFDCGCGIEGCSGWHEGIKITKKNGKIRWLINEHKMSFKKMQNGRR